jgi:hypothetical protein
MKRTQLVIALSVGALVSLGEIGCTSKKSTPQADIRPDAKPSAVGAIPATSAPPVAAPSPVTAEPAAVGAYSALIINLHSGGEMLLTDASGRRTGYNQANGSSWQEIPNSTYGDESIDAPDDDASTDEKSLDLRPPAPGVYTLTVYGTREGAYDLELRATKGAELEPPIVIRDVPSTPGSKETYTISVPAGREGTVGISSAKNRT